MVRREAGAVRELHVVAVSEDGRHVVLASSKGSTKGTHRIRLDARLMAAVRGELGADHGHDLSPKEIQARLRAGESAEQIANAAGMALSRVERFAGPVAGEMARVIDQAREAYVVRGRLGRSSAPLGVAVDAALADTRPETVVWSTRREEDGRWRVQVAWTARGRARSGAWFFEPQVRGLEAADPSSAALGHVDAAPAPARRTAKRPAPARPAEPVAKAARKAPAVSRTTTPAVTRPARAPASKPAPAPVRKAPARAAAATPVAATKTAEKKAASKVANKAQKKAADKVAKKAADKVAKKAASKAPRPRLRVVPDPPTVRTPPATPPGRSAVDEREGVRSRASVPGWADVLLGTTPSGEK